MPIREISNRPRIPIAGVIRLGVRKESKSGSSYPKSTEYFVLDDAPNVRKVYGDDPKELDIMFPVANPEMILPTWYKLWTPSLKKGGRVEQGKLLCKGDGPFENNPGRAEWYDRTKVPASGAISDRDPVNGVILRACWGKGCIDAYDEKGNPKCKQTMQVFCILPLVSYGEIYIISTSSWNSIRSFHDWITWHLTAFGPQFITSNYYKISREEEGTRYYDKKENCDKIGSQFIMKLSPRDRQEFETLHAGRLSETRVLLQPGEAAKLLPSAHEADNIPMDELYPCIDVSNDEQPQMKKSERLLAEAEALLDDPEIIAAFDNFERAKGKKLDRKQRLTGIRMRQDAPDIKAAVLEALIVQEAPQEPAAVEPAQSPVLEELIGTAPPTDSDSLIL